MKTIKIKFLGFWNGFDAESFFITKCLREKYNVEITEDADYAIISVFDYHHSYCNFKGVRIYYSGENVPPDFSEMDYAIGFDDIHFGDRYFRYPISYNRVEIGKLAENKQKGVTGDILQDKEYFCTFMYSHEGIKERTELFHILSSYRPVTSVGKYLHNTDIHIPYEANHKSKLAFQHKAKFVLAVENTSYPGYATEKILHAFASQSIPIYYGDPTISREFNSKAFINCHDYNSFEEVLEVVKKLDADDALYLEMLKQPAFLEENYVQNRRAQFADFLYNIFDQEYQAAFRRPLDGICLDRENWIKNFLRLQAKYANYENRKLLNRIRNRLKRKK